MDAVGLVSRIIGFDGGDRRIGLAISDPLAVLILQAFLQARENRIERETTSHDR